MPISFRSLLSLLLTLNAILAIASAQNSTAPQPKYRYLADAAALSAGEVINGPARVLDLKGRKWCAHEAKRRDDVLPQCQVPPETVFGAVHLREFFPLHLAPNDVAA